MAAYIRQLLLVALTAGAAGILYNALRPSGFSILKYDPSAAVKAEDERAAVERARQKEEAEKKGIPKIGIEEARGMFQSWVPFVDARPPGQFGAGRVQNAYNMTEADFEGAFRRFRAESGGYPADQPVVVYCGGEDCALAFRVAIMLKAKGYSDVRVFEGGWQAWLDAAGRDPAGFPIQ